MDTPQYLTVSEAARRLGALPRDITNAFYMRQLRDDIAPIIGGRRVIPMDYLNVVRMVLKRNGRKLADVEASNV